MPRNKEALIRYRVINRCLIDYKILKMKLLVFCKQLWRDIQVIRAFQTATQQLGART